MRDLMVEWSEVNDSVVALHSISLQGRARSLTHQAYQQND
jgi:hypothetical protein